MALKLKMICGPYDRAQALIDGSVKPEGIDLEITVNRDLPGSPESSREGYFDMVEFYTVTYMGDLAYKRLAYTAIPIFVKRMHRHSYMYVNKNSGIRTPADLHGKRVAIQSWFTTTALWGRGILSDEYGVDLAAVNWVATNTVGMGKDWKGPDWMRLEVADGASQKDMLASGAVDACITTAVLAPDVDSNIDFLFPNYADLERDYYKKTGFFPIMHTLLVKNSVLEEHAWVAMSLYNAWQESKQRCYQWLEWQRIHQTALWYRALWEEERAVAGPDPYVWGLSKSRAELDKMLEWAYRDGITPRRHEPEEMFHPSTLET